LTLTIVESGPRIVAMMPAPRTPTIATAPNNVKNTLPRSDLRFLMDLIVIEPRYVCGVLFSQERAGGP
jgi:hypothetical protein